MTNNGNSVGGVLVAFAVGAMAGAAVALLFAPATGEETRHKLAEKAKEGRDKATVLARKGQEYLHRQRDNLTAAVDRGREAFDQARHEKESL